MTSTNEHYITIPLQSEAYEYAQKFASSQPSTEKSQQVYRNTLAVWAINEFVQEINYETDLEAGDSWHLVIRMFHDVADLVLPNIGKLESRLIESDSELISLPPEALEDRIAYIAVQLEEELKRVKLRGFIPACEVKGAEIQVADLKPIEELLDYLYRLEVAIPFVEEKINSVVEDDEVDMKVRERLRERSLSEIAMILEQLYRNVPPEQWWEQSGKELVGRGASAASNQREKGNNLDIEDAEVILSDLGEEWLQELAEIWGHEEE